MKVYCSIHGLSPFCVEPNDPAKCYLCGDSKDIEVIYYHDDLKREDVGVLVEKNGSRTDYR